MILYPQNRNILQPINIQVSKKEVFSIIVKQTIDLTEKEVEYLYDTLNNSNPKNEKILNQLHKKEVFVNNQPKLFFTILFKNLKDNVQIIHNYVIQDS